MISEPQADHLMICYCTNQGYLSLFPCFNGPGKSNWIQWNLAYEEEISWTYLPIGKHQISNPDSPPPCHHKEKRVSWVNVPKLFNSQGSDILRHLIRVEDTFLGGTCGHTLQIVKSARPFYIPGPSESSRMGKEEAERGGGKNWGKIQKVPQKRSVGPLLISSSFYFFLIRSTDFRKGRWSNKDICIHL